MEKKKNAIRHYESFRDACAEQNRIASQDDEIDDNTNEGDEDDY